MLLLAIANIISYDTFRVEIYAKKAFFHYRTCLGSGFVCQGDLVDLFLYPDVSPGPLQNIALGAKRASLLFTAIEMDIFSGLCEDISAYEFARRRDTMSGIPNICSMPWFPSGLFRRRTPVLKTARYPSSIS